MTKLWLRHFLPAALFRPDLPHPRRVFSFKAQPERQLPSKPFCGDTDHPADLDSRFGSRAKVMWVGDLPDAEMLATGDVRNA
jgi:hypothetical protein